MGVPFCAGWGCVGGVEVGTAWDNGCSKEQLIFSLRRDLLWGEKSD
jgi:hypothetical protein